MKYLIVTILAVLSFGLNAQVGIGTTSPTVELDVESAAATTAIDINNTAANGDPIIHFQLGGVASFTMGVDDDDSDKFKIGTTGVATSTRLTIDGTGQFGIGATAPVANLEIEDAGIPALNGAILKITADDQNPYGIIIGNDTYSTTDTDGMSMYVADAGDAVLQANGGNLSLGKNGSNGDEIYITSSEVIINDDSNSGLDFRVEGDTKASLFLVDASVDAIDIGDGGVAPRATIDIFSTDAAVILNAYDDANVPQLFLYNADASETLVDDNDNLGEIIFGGFDGTNYIPAAGIKGEIDSGTGVNDMPGRLLFYTTANGASTLSERMSIDDDGDLAIGRTSAAYRLDVQDDYSTGYAARFFNDGDNADRYGIDVKGGADDGSGQTFYVDCFDGDGTNIGYIENNGGTFQLVDLSDRTTKTNIESTEIYGIGTIENLRVVDFTRIDHKENPRVHHGFIAQEVSKAYPYMVSRASNGKLGIAKEQLIPVLVKATQEQQAEIEDLQYQIDLLVAMNKQLIAVLNNNGISTEEVDSTKLEEANENAQTKEEQEKTASFTQQVENTPEMESQTIERNHEEEEEEREATEQKTTIKGGKQPK